MVVKHHPGCKPCGAQNRAGVAPLEGPVIRGFSVNKPLILL